MAKGVRDITVDDIRRAVSAAAVGTPIQRAYLFGSRARGDNEIGSDIDLALETGPGFSLIDVGFFREAVERACGRPVDIVSEEYLLPSMRETLRRERVLVYERQSHGGCS